jgi:hypothetical protein
MPAARYFAATIGATCSSVWNSITGQTFSYENVGVVRDFRAGAIVERDELTPSAAAAR